MTDSETTPHDKCLFELNKARLDFAWNNFEHTTSQRMTMFNFYIVFMGALLYAFATTLKNDHTEIIHFGIGIFGAVTGIIFWLLDRRNQYLYLMAEYNILLLERTFLYTESDNGVDKQRSPYKGIFTTQLEYGCDLRRIEDHMHAPRYLRIETYRHLMPLFYWITVFVFLAIAAYSLKYSPR
jgi:hypothetical protein